MFGTKRQEEKAREDRPKYISLCAYLDGPLFATHETSRPSDGPVKDKNKRGYRGG